MQLSLLTIPLVLALAGLLYLVFRSLARAWLDHRIRMAILEKAERKPEFLELLDDTAAPTQETEASHDAQPKADLTLTGVILGLIGLIFVLVNGVVGKSQWSVGAYFGGVACVVIGFILASVGLLTRYLEGAPLGSKKGRG